MAHGKAKLTVPGRLLLVQRIEAEGWPAATAAEAQGVSRATAYKWLQRWRSEGLAGLADRSSRPHRSPGRTAPAVEAAIVAARLAARKGPHRIGYELGVAPSTVHAVLVRVGLSRLDRLDGPTGLPVRYVRDRPGELIHVDVKKLGRIPPGGGWRVVCLRVRCVRGGDCRCAATAGTRRVVPALSGRGGRRPIPPGGSDSVVPPCRWSRAGRAG